MSHLGDRIAALVDGELTHDERDRLLGHVTRCPACRAEVEAVRFVKTQMVRLRGPAPTVAFTDRLKALSEPGEPLPPARPRMPRGSLSPTPTATFPTVRPVLRRSGERHGSRRPVRGARVLAAAASVTTVTMTGAFLLGGESGSDGRPVVPPVEEFAVEHVGTSRVVPLTDPVVAAVAVGGPGTVFGSARPPLSSPRPSATATGGLPTVSSSARPTATSPAPPASVPASPSVAPSSPR